MQTFKTSFMKYKLWSLQKFNIYISFQQAQLTVTHFPVAHSMYAEVKNFSIQTSIEQKCEGAPLVLHQNVS